MARLPHEFYNRDTVQVAQDLLYRPRGRSGGGGSNHDDPADCRIPLLPE